MKQESTPLKFARSLAIGVLFSMAFFYCIHLLGKWKVEEYRPDPETTSSLLLINTCAILGDTHTLRPGSPVDNTGNGISGIKLAASFMNFFDGHIVGLIILALVVGVGIFFLRNSGKKNKQVQPGVELKIKN